MAGKRDKVKDNERYSIVQDRPCCYICGVTENLHMHEVFGGSNRAKSKEDGCCIYLCAPHHNMSSLGIHFNAELNDSVKANVEKIWIKTYYPDMEFEKAQKLFIKRYGKNYVD